MALSRILLAAALALSGCAGEIDLPGSPDAGEPAVGADAAPEESGGCEASAWAWPTPESADVVQGFGNPIEYQSCGFHTGIDITADSGSPIVAMAGGEVVHVGPMWLDGPNSGRGPYAIIIDHGGGLYSTYGHNSAARVSAGDCVAEGDRIADVGSLGYSSGPHLHLEVLAETSFTGDWEVPFADACSRYVDPLEYVSPP